MVKKKKSTWQISDEELAAKLSRARRLGDSEPDTTASGFSFNRDTRTIRIELPNNAVLTFPATNIKELQGASEEEIERGYLTLGGTALRWDQFDADYTIAGFVANQFGTKEWMRELGRRGGQAKSKAKAAAARLNGMRGGRPRQTPVELSNRNEAVGTASIFATRSAALLATQLDILSVGETVRIQSESSFVVLQNLNNKIWQH